MTCKIKCNEETGFFKVKLGFTELQLIARLVSQVRLGQGDCYSEAAFEILNAIEKCEGDQFFTDAEEDIRLNLTLEDSNGETVLALSSDNIVFEASESFNPEEDSADEICNSCTNSGGCGCNDTTSCSLDEVAE